MKTKKWCQPPKSGRRSTNLERKFPSYTKKGPGRYPVIGKKKEEIEYANET
jgi:hypothetical protein